MFYPQSSEFLRLIPRTDGATLAGQGIKHYSFGGRMEMKRITWVICIVGALAVIGCQNQQVSTQPDWVVARRKLRLKPEDCQKASIPDNRDARSSESITEGDPISLQHEGWSYTWRLESVNGTNIVLKPIEAKRAK